MPAVQNLAATLGLRLYGILTLLTFGLVTLSTVLLLVVLPGRERRRHVVRGAAKLTLLAGGARPAVAGLEHLPQQPCVVVANHCSYLDGVILTAVLPPRFTFVIKQEMRRIPVAHFLLRRIGSEFVERFDRRQGANDARRIMRKASRRDSLVFFPEGTFTEVPGLRRFQRGAFLAAVRGKLPVVPVIINGSRRMLPADRWLPRPGPLSVQIMAPLQQRDAEALMHAARNRILAELGEPDLATR